jgi:hypothetical protein
MEEQMKPGYLTAELNVTDERVFFEEYMPRVKPVIERRRCGVTNRAAISAAIYTSYFLC